MTSLSYISCARFSYLGIRKNDSLQWPFGVEIPHVCLDDGQIGVTAVILESAGRGDRNGGKLTKKRVN